MVPPSHANPRRIAPRPAGCCSIIPPYLLRRLASSGDDAAAARARTTLRVDRTLRAERSAPAGSVAPSGEERPRPVPSRRIYDAKNTSRLPGRFARGEGDAEAADPAVNEVYDGFGLTWALWFEAYGRNSIDDHGLALLGTVHYGKRYDNAFWDGSQMVFGDGDGEIFGSFTASLDVIGHELTHGVTQHTAGLVYQGQSGALNEHVSDVFGALLKQRSLGQSAGEADWLIGAELLLPGVAGVALRNMLHPGTAYDDPRLGQDPQPDHLSRYVVTADDNGGVHINSGIPNRAFALAATALGGSAWEGVGRIWADVVLGGDLSAEVDFLGFAEATRRAASTRFGDGSREASAVSEAWDAVGLGVGAEGVPTAVPPKTETDLLLRRSGGFAGITRERAATLDELPPKDATQWSRLLVSRRLVLQSEATSGWADGFRYRVCSRRLDLDLTVAEHRLTEAQRRLFERTLEATDRS